MNPSRRRKIVYLLVIVALFTAQIPLAGVIRRQAEAKELAQASLGNVDPMSGTLQLVIGGFRGVAVTFLWNEAIDLNKKERHFELKPVIESITLLQPNFSSPWQFQAWNLSYNVANLWESVADKYYWIKEGVMFMKNATRKNRNVPDLEYYGGWIYYNKFTVADEKVFLREQFRQDKENPEFTTSRRQVERADPLECAYDLYETAVGVVLNTKLDQLRRKPRNQGMMVFLSHPARARVGVATWRVKEGLFGPTTKEAWNQANDEWTEKLGKAYGSEEAGPKRDAFLPRLEWSPEEWAGLSEEDKYWVNKRGDIVRYQYWKTSIRAESTDTMLTARKAIFEAEQARDGGDYAAAIEKYQEAFPLFRKVIEDPRFIGHLKEDTSAIDDAQKWESDYFKLLTNLGEKRPAKRPFEGLFEQLPLEETQVGTSGRPTQGILPDEAAPGAGVGKGLLDAGPSVPAPKK